MNLTISGDNRASDELVPPKPRTLQHATYARLSSTSKWGKLLFANRFHCILMLQFASRSIIRSMHYNKVTMNTPSFCRVSGYSKQTNKALNQALMQKFAKGVGHLCVVSRALITVKVLSARFRDSF